jgi:hypothetical protein
MMKDTKLIALLLCAALLVAGCGGGASKSTIGGTVTGLSANTTVGLLNNGTDALSVGANGSFAFAGQIQAGSIYNVTLSTDPVGETCTVLNGLGTVSASIGDVASIVVSCVPQISANNEVTGIVSGLTAGNSVTLLNNGNDAVTVTANGPFVFKALNVPATYSVVVSVPPSGQTCTVANGTGKILASGTIPTVTVTCI